MTNRQRLERAGLIKPGAKLSQQQQDALETLSREELDSLTSVKKKLAKKTVVIPGLMGAKQRPKP
jgi:hypothetical protein